MSRYRVDHCLQLKIIPVIFLDDTNVEATAEGNNAAWRCSCGQQLVRRCYFQFGDTCDTSVRRVRKRYRVLGDDKKRTVSAVEEPAVQPPLAGIQ